MARTNFDHPVWYGEECCYELQDCRLLGCGSKVAFGSGCAFSDLANPDWQSFDIPNDLLSFNLDTTADVENYNVIGSCDDRCKVAGRHWSLNGSLYWCREDVPACRVCLEGSCVSFCLAPCGLGYVYDTTGEVPDEGDLGTGDVTSGGGVTGVNPNIVAPNNTAIYFGTGVVNSCSLSVQPNDYMTANFSVTGCGRLYRYNMCSSGLLIPETISPDGLGAPPGLGPIQRADGRAPLGRITAPRPDELEQRTQSIFTQDALLNDKGKLVIPAIQA